MSIQFQNITEPRQLKSEIQCKVNMLDIKRLHTNKPPSHSAKMAALSEMCGFTNNSITLNESYGIYVLSYLIIRFSYEFSNDRTCGVYTLLSLPKRKNLHRRKESSDPILWCGLQIESRDVLRDIWYMRPKIILGGV